MFNTNNQKMYGGANKKQGLPPSIGFGHFSTNLIQRKAGYCRCLSANLYSGNTTIPATSTPLVF